MSSKARLVVLLIISHAAAWAAPCPVSDSLANFIGFGAPGCSIGAFTYKDFAFSLTGGTVDPISAATTTITLSPSPAGSIDLTFDPAAFLVEAGDSATYLLEYTVDPPPVIIHGYRMDLDVLSPVAPGSATITSDICRTAAFVAGVCPAGVPNTFQVVVFDDDIAPVLTAGVNFGLTNIVGVRITIDLDATAGGSSDFDSFTQRTSVPEPATWTMLAAGLAGLALLRRRRR